MISLPGGSSALVVALVAAAAVWWRRLGLRGLSGLDCGRVHSDLHCEDGRPVLRIVRYFFGNLNKHELACLKRRGSLLALAQ